MSSRQNRHHPSRRCQSHSFTGLITAEHAAKIRRGWRRMPRVTLCVEVRARWFLCLFETRDLTKRALLLHNDLIHWDEGFVPRSFDWRTSSHEIGPAIGGFPVNQRSISADADPATYEMRHTKDVPFAFLQRDDVSVWPPYGGRRVLFLASNRGQTVDFVKNPHYRQWMHERDLSARTSWACAFRSMFEPSAEVYRAHGALFDRIRPLNGRCVAVTVRVGDAFFANNSFSSFSELEPYWRCAARATQDLIGRERIGGRAAVADVPWLVNSDSVDVRRYALQRWGPERIITDPVTPSVHVNCDRSSPAQAEYCRRGMVDATGALFAMSLCDAHVFLDRSGYASSAAFAALSPFLYPLETDWDGQKLRLTAAAASSTCAQRTPEDVALMGAGK
jgi:hypothetical protein